jgi:hypothetical protein
LLLRFVPFIQLLAGMFGVNNGNDRIQFKAFCDLLIDEEGCANVGILAKQAPSISDARFMMDAIVR